MIKLVSKDKCTGCGACSYICPKGCIEMKENDMHELLPVINAYMCVECGKCVKICPVLNLSLIHIFCGLSTDRYRGRHTNQRTVCRPDTFCNTSRTVGSLTAVRIGNFLSKKAFQEPCNCTEWHGKYWWTLWLPLRI